MKQASKMNEWVGRGERVSNTTDGSNEMGTKYWPLYFTTWLKQSSRVNERRWISVVNVENTFEWFGYEREKKNEVVAWGTNRKGRKDFFSKDGRNNSMFLCWAE